MLETIIDIQRVQETTSALIAKGPVDIKIEGIERIFNLALFLQMRVVNCYLDNSYFVSWTFLINLEKIEVVVKTILLLLHGNSSPSQSDYKFKDFREILKS